LKLIAFQNARHVAQFIKITWLEGREGMAGCWDVGRARGTITCYGERKISLIIKMLDIEGSEEDNSLGAATCFEQEDDFN